MIKYFLITIIITNLFSNDFKLESNSPIYATFITSPVYINCPKKNNLIKSKINTECYVYKKNKKMYMSKKTAMRIKKKSKNIKLKCYYFKEYNTFGKCKKY
jgi:hypothetical protein